MNRTGRTGGRGHTLEKQPSRSESENKKNWSTLLEYMKYEFVRCHLVNGTVYCGFVKSFNISNSIELLHPYIEQSPVDLSQPSPTSVLKVNMRDIYKISTQHSVRSAPTKSSPATLQVGIMESLFLSSADPLPGASPSPAFDDVDRRKKARNVTTHRELENNFDFLTDSRDVEELEERGFRMGAYDQFAENQTKFGVQSDFDITVYSTHVNADEVPEELRIAAERMERELHSSRDTTNIHILEERGISIQANEEERYSRVHGSTPSTTTASPSTTQGAGRRGRGGRHAPGTENRSSGECELTRDIMRKVPDVTKQSAKPVTPAAAAAPAPSTPPAATSTSAPAPSIPTTTSAPTPAAPTTTPSTTTPAPTTTTKPLTSKLNPGAREFKMSANAPEFTMKTNPVVPVQMVPNQMMPSQMMPNQVMPNQVMLGRQPVMTPQNMVMGPVVMGPGMPMPNQMVQVPNGQPVFVQRFPYPMVQMNNMPGFVPNGYIPMGQVPMGQMPMAPPTQQPKQS